MQQEDERGPVSGTYASLRPQPQGGVVMLSSTLSEDEDLDMDATDYSQYASTGAENPSTNFAGTLCMLPHLPHAAPAAHSQSPGRLPSSGFAGWPESHFWAKAGHVYFLHKPKEVC